MYSAKEFGRKKEDREKDIKWEKAKNEDSKYGKRIGIGEREKGGDAERVSGERQKKRLKRK